ncbi:alpha/beta hydrolase [Phaeobacter sp. NW0010-22]|uniref:alpha/beta hydrolase n=1 Tax=Phaeobacter sp. NW0010-22 TaxID=3135907 RepID=UPI00310BD40B
MKLLNPIIALLATTVIAANMASAEGEFGYNVELDVAYGKGVVRSDRGLVERDLLLDVYTPSTNNADYTKTDAVAETLRPAVILVYGGGFQRGGRRQAPYTEFDAIHSRMEDYARLLTPLGYVTFVIEYRLAPELPEPTMALDVDWVLTMEEDLTDAGMRRVNFAREALGLGPLEGDEGKTVVWKTILSAAEDLEKAVDFVRASSEQFGVDPARIALGGHSAGAATVINAAHGLDVPVAAIFPLSPPLSAIDLSKTITSADETPTFHVVSQYDEPAVLEKAPGFTQAMRSAGADYELVWVPGFPHFYPYNSPSLSDDGTRQALSERLIDFLEEQLMK